MLDRALDVVSRGLRLEISCVFIFLVNGIFLVTKFFEIQMWQIRRTFPDKIGLQAHRSLEEKHVKHGRYSRAPYIPWLDHCGFAKFPESWR
jgi:hypothetical protein